MKKTAIISLIFLLQLLQTYQKDLQVLNSLDQIRGSGDSYPTILPIVTNPQAFRNVDVLFLLADGVEDNEVYYTHQYLIDRGAQVQFACLRNQPVEGQAQVEYVIISDFYKPSYKIQCYNIETINFNAYDVLYIPGGLPSSGALKSSDNVKMKIAGYQYQGKPKFRVIASICSGTEVVLSSMDNILKLPKLTGSPASKWTFYSFLGFNKLPQSTFDFESQQYEAITYMKNFNQQATYVFGRNPDASPRFVQELGRSLGLEEPLATEQSNTRLNIVNGKYNHPQFQSFSENEPLSNFPEAKDIKPSRLGYKLMVALRGMNPKYIALAISQGANYYQVESIITTAAKAGIQLKVVCPDWIIDYKGGEVYLFSEIPTRPFAKVICDASFSQAKDDTAIDSIIIPSGLFSTNGVLRNDDALKQLIEKSILYTTSVTTIAFIGTGIELMVPLKLIQQEILPSETLIPMTEAIRDDLQWSAYREDYYYREKVPIKIGNVELNFWKFKDD